MWSSIEFASFEVDSWDDKLYLLMCKELLDDDERIMFHVGDVACASHPPPVTLQLHKGPLPCLGDID